MTTPSPTQPRVVHVRTYGGFAQLAAGVAGGGPFVVGGGRVVHHLLLPPGSRVHKGVAPARRGSEADLRTDLDRHLAALLVSGVVLLARRASPGDQLMQRRSPWLSAGPLLRPRRQVVGLGQLDRPRVGSSAAGVPVP